MRRVPATEGSELDRIVRALFITRENDFIDWNTGVAQRGERSEHDVGR